MKNDKDIEKLLNEHCEAQSIKTTALDILRAYDERQAAAKRRPASSRWRIGGPLLALAGTALIAGIIIGVLPRPDVVPPVIYNSRKSQAAFSVLSGMSLVTALDEASLEDPSSPLSLPFSMRSLALTRSEADDEDDDDEEEPEEISAPSVTFADVVDAFDPAVTTIRELLTNSTNTECTFTKAPDGESFQGPSGVEYPYELIVGDYVMYSELSLAENDDEDDEGEAKEKQEYRGEIFKKDTSRYYPVTMTIEKETETDETETEIEFAIKLSDRRTLSISQEISVEDEERERSYEYVLTEDDNEILSQEITFEDEKDQNTECELAVKKDGIEYVFEEITRPEGATGLVCFYQIGEDDEETKMSMREDDGTRTYTNNKDEPEIRPRRQ